MKLISLLLILSFCICAHNAQSQNNLTLFPKNNATDVNPDAQLKITFNTSIVFGNKGKIRIYDALTNILVDSLDMSIPPGPRNTRTPSPYDTLKYLGVPDVTYTVNKPDRDTSHIYQLNYIGGNEFYDACHFFPVLINDRTATITLHNNHLKYNKTYYVNIDPEVFPLKDGSFPGISDKTTWVFATKATPPSNYNDYLVVAADGSGDFNTVQGAFDFIPDNNTDHKTIVIKNGIYEEMVVLKSKHNLTILGEDRDNTIIRYPNNGVFNYRRYEFTIHGCNDINLVNFSTISVGDAPAQAEGLCIKGNRNQVHNVTVIGSGDAVQAGGTVFMSHSSIKGYGDNVLGAGIFFNQCDFITTYGPHLWARNSKGNPGYVLNNCRLWKEGDGEAIVSTFARAPIKSNYSFPFTETILLNCAIDDIPPGGWGESTDPCVDSHCWEYNSVNLKDGSPADISQRVPYSRQLSMENDSQIIANYSNPEFFLKGWKPQYYPKILSKPTIIEVSEGAKTKLMVEVAAAPIPTYQWFKNGILMEGQESSVLIIDPVTASDGGVYSVEIENELGNDRGNVVTLVVNNTPE